MIPNLLNTALGLALVYCAILAPGALRDEVWPLIAASAAVIALGWWARRADRLKWFNLVNIVLGVALLVLGIVHILMPVPALVMFWWVFWVGIIVAVMAFWSALYTRETAAAPN